MFQRCCCCETVSKNCRKISMMEVSFSKVVVFQPKLLLRNETLRRISSCKLYDIFVNVYCSDQLQAGCFLKIFVIYCNLPSTVYWNMCKKKQFAENDLWDRGAVFITAAQFNSNMPELRFCICSNPTRGVSGICISKNFQQQSRLDLFC